MRITLQRARLRRGAPLSSCGGERKRPNAWRCTGGSGTAAGAAGAGGPTPAHHAGESGEYPHFRTGDTGARRSKTRLHAFWPQVLIYRNTIIPHRVSARKGNLPQGRGLSYSQRTSPGVMSEAIHPRRRAGRTMTNRNSSHSMRVVAVRPLPPARKCIKTISSEPTGRPRAK